MKLKRDAKFGEESTCCFKIDIRNLTSFDLSTRKSQKFHFIGLLLFELKKYRGVISHDIEEWCKIWRKTDLLLGKWHEKFGKFSPEHSKVSKLELWWDLFVQSRKCMSLEFTEKIWQWRMIRKLKRNWLVALKLIWGISRIFTRALKSLKKLLFNWLLWQKYMMFELRKAQRIYVWWHWILIQNWRKSDLCVFKNDTSNLANMHRLK